LGDHGLELTSEEVGVGNLTVHNKTKRQRPLEAPLQSEIAGLTRQPDTDHARPAYVEGNPFSLQNTRRHLLPSGEYDLAPPVQHDAAQLYHGPRLHQSSHSQETSKFPFAGRVLDM
jgi:hypothetical protein